MNKHHGYSGACDPERSINTSFFMTFSVGCFEIIPKKSGNGTKKSKVKVRVVGSISNTEAVYAKAREICDELDAGTYAGPKSVRVK
jgi:hypothetical protein